MAHKIQIKRGNKADLPTLDAGEFGLCQDTNELFIGNSGNQKIFPPTAPTISDVEGLQTALDGKVDNSRVLTDVPAGAKFTDTVYTHPANHAPSIITQDANNRFVTDAEKSIWNSKADGTHTHDDRYYTEAEVNALLDGKVDDSQVLTNVPANAKFTDTVTTINGKTGAIAKSDITALGIPAQDTVYTHPATHSADMIVDGTTNKAYTATEKNKLAGIETGANKTTIANNLTETVPGKALDATQGKELHQQIGNKSNKSVLQTKTLSAASWVGSVIPYTYTLSVTGVTPTSVQEILPTTDITEAQLAALLNAIIQDGGQSTNTVVLKAWGEKPIIDIPIRVILRGDM
jgi:hypothetical protein